MDNSHQLRIGASGMRGIVGSGLTPESAMDFASAFASIGAERKHIFIAGDNRGSSAMLVEAVAAAVSGCGAQVMYGGVLPAGMVQSIVGAEDFDGGLLVTGGHQKAGWNAIIPLDENGAYFDSVRSRELFDRYLSKSFRAAGAEELHRAEDLDERMIERYWERFRTVVDCRRIAAAHLKVAIDFCNGSGGFFADRFAQELGVELMPVNTSTSGVLPHDPEPGIAAAATLSSVIRFTNPDIGIVFNSDLSRMSLVTEKAEALSEEFTCPLAADYLLERAASAADGRVELVTNICSSGRIDFVAKKHGAKLLKTQVGQPALMTQMHRADALLAGDGSGSFALRGTVDGFDGFLMAALLLESLSVPHARRLSERVAEYPTLFMVKEKFFCSTVAGYRLLRRLRNFFPEAKCGTVDGVRFDWGDGWLSLRYSATEQALRIIAESVKHEYAADRVRRICAALEE
ncbi:MAG: hypothetical protein PHS41_11155 [Victivallaceae bacterium]|nr:hypothetical protein [Victivallaceae bacterium]